MMLLCCLQREGIATLRLILMVLNQDPECLGDNSFGATLADNGW